jgi:hypothetical protein
MNNSAFFLFIFTFIIIIIIIIFRLRKVKKGTKVSVKKTILFSTYFVAIASFLVYNSFLVSAIPHGYLISYFGVAVAATYGSYIYSKRSLSFWRVPPDNIDGDSSSSIYSKGGLAVYLLYVSALTIRVAINFFFIGSEIFYFNNQTILENSSAVFIMPMLRTDTATTILAFAATDFLLMVSVGLVIGRNARVLRYYYQIKKRIL